MKTIAIAALLALGIGSRCMAAGDAVSSVKKEDNREITTFQRDGKTILQIIL